MSTEVKKYPLLGLLLVVLMLASSFWSPDLAEVGEVANTSHGSGLEVDCSNYSFEELFVYDYATYNLDLNTDWLSGWLTASAFVNDSNAASVRTDLDALLDGVPGGNNEYISTDEREAVRQVGPDCIEDMVTKLGLREGMSHRGGVDWNDLEWYGDGIKLDEYNLVPDDHPQERNCVGAWTSTDCKEVPVEITDDLEIHLLADTDNSSKNIKLNQLSNHGNSNFTFASNTTNMTKATITVTFPPVNGLRIVTSELLRDGVTQTMTPQQEPTQSIGADGSLTFAFDTTYDLVDWPMIQELFIDFTTDPLDTNDPPEWDVSAPENDTVIPIVNDGSQVLMLTGAHIDNFLVDEGDVQMTCSGPTGWSFQTSQDGDLMVTPNGDSATVTCNGVDEHMQASSERSWTVAQPIELSGGGDYLNTAPITLTPSPLVSSPDVSLVGVQGTRTTAPVAITGLSAETTLDLDLAGLNPGEFSVQVSATASGMLDWSGVVDLGLSKTGQPPTIIVDLTLDGENGTWDDSGYSFSLSGTFYEPDGESVQFSVEVCGFSTTSVNQMGANWDATVSVAGCTEHDSYSIIITVTDSTGLVAQSVVNTLPPGGDSGDSSSGGGGAITSDDSGGLPAPGLAISLIVVAFAAIIRRKD